MSTYNDSSILIDETTPEFQKRWENEYENKMIFSGRLTTFLAALLTFLPALYLCFWLDIRPTWGQISAGWANVVAAYALLYFAEPLSYYPVMGLSGIYIGYLAGNIPSVRLPAMLAAQAATGAKAGTKRGELVGTIAIGSSVFVNLIFVTLAAVAGHYILSILPEFVIKAFDYTLPGILGGVMAQYFIQNSKIFTVVMIGICIVIQLAPIPSFVKFPLAIILALVLGYMVYQKSKAASEKGQTM